MKKKMAKKGRYRKNMKVISNYEKGKGTKAINQKKYPSWTPFDITVVIKNYHQKI